MLSERELYIAIVGNDKLSPADAIIVLEGDGKNRIEHTVELFQNGYAPVIVFSGGITDYKYGSYPFEDIADAFYSRGVKDSDMIIEDRSTQTQQQAVEIVNLAVENGWQKLILVASSEHQYRAYLTFLKEILTRNLDIIIYNSPANKLLWFCDEGWGARYERISSEFERIDKYYKLGHLASYADAIKYQRWKEEHQ